MVYRREKPLQVKNRAPHAKKFKHQKKKVLRTMVDAFKSLAKGAKHAVSFLLEEWLELNPNLFRPKKLELIQKHYTTPQEEEEGVYMKTLLPPMVGRDWNIQKTIVLDLDETLISTSHEPVCYDFFVEVVCEGWLTRYYVLVRPGVQELLKELGRDYELVLFTAGQKEYADPIVDRIDPYRAIKYRLFRDSCTFIEGKFVKDLSLLGRDLKRVIIVDDNPNAYMFHPNNAISVSPFQHDMYDRELIGVISFFKAVQGYEDLREALSHYTVNH